MMFLKIAVNSFSSFFFSTESVSTKNRFTSPKQQPVMTPKTLPLVLARVTDCRISCSGSKRGNRNPNRNAAFSIELPKSTPEVSLKICPIAAAAKLEMPNVTPTLASMASPAYIKTVLSTNPNAMNGTPLKRKIFFKSSEETGATVLARGGDAFAVAALREVPPDARKQLGRDVLANALDVSSAEGTRERTPTPSWTVFVKKREALATTRSRSPRPAPAIRDAAPTAFRNAAPEWSGITVHDVDADAEVLARASKHAAARRTVIVG